jgi:hypothetical protein
MSSNDTPIHHGTFAEGEAHPDTYAGEDRVGSFAEGEAHPDAHMDEGHVGSFAEGTGHTESR